MRDWSQAKALLDEPILLFPEEPFTVRLLGRHCALLRERRNAEQELECVTRAYSSPKSFVHALNCDWRDRRPKLAAKIRNRRARSICPKVVEGFPWATAIFETKSMGVSSGKSVGNPDHALAIHHRS